MENQQNQVQGPVKNNDSYLLVTIMWITNIIGGVGFWIALILFFVKKDDFVVRDACRKYLNLCILYILAIIALIVLAVVLGAINQNLALIAASLGYIAIIIHALVNVIIGLIASLGKKDFNPWLPIFEVIKR